MRAADNAMNVVILDACRNNPFSRSFRTFSPGLAQVNAAAGTFISFATAPGQVAADGDGNNGLFTGKLLEHLQTPGLKIEEVFKRTTADVYTASNERQAPWVQYSVIGDFYFAPGDMTPVAVGTKPKELPTQRPKPAKGAGVSGEAAIKKLLTTKECVRCDLRGANLKSADLEHANLRAAYLYGADLRGASLEGADLTDANLLDAKINLTDFLNVMSAKFCNTTMLYGEIENRDCDQPVQQLSKSEVEVVLSGNVAKKKLLDTKECVGCDLRGAKLIIADLRNADLRKANLYDANLWEADLSEADLRNADLREANLYRVALIGADLSEASLKNTNLAGANLSKAYLYKASLIGADLSEAKFCNTIMPDGSINNSDC